MMGIKSYFDSLIKPTHVVPLIIFRIAFGLLMVISQTRFLLKGWVEELYLSPTFHFTFPGFAWVAPLPEFWMYATVIVSIVLAFMIAIGFFYRFAIVSFFLVFTYLELIDIAWYLNHYYFISLIALLLIFLPANTAWSLDAYFFSKVRKTTIPRFQIEIIKWQLVLVYCFAGIAKINYDWLILAQPMKIWLAARTDFPIIGAFFGEEWVVYGFSWLGMIYDCAIPFFLFKNKTRPYAFLAVIIFHSMTWILFNIGMFPWIMIAASLIFFKAEDWKKTFSFFKIDPDFFSTIAIANPSKISRKTNLIEADNEDLRLHDSKFYNSVLAKWGLIAYFFVQIALPLRQHFHTGNPLWTELGYRFSWNVMLAEKTGYCHFNITDQSTGRNWVVQPSEYLNYVQEKQMSFQPDLIWQFAQHLNNIYKLQGYDNLSITVHNKVSLNGRKSDFLINPAYDLLQIKSVHHLSQAIITFQH